MEKRIRYAIGVALCAALLVPPASASASPQAKKVSCTKTKGAKVVRDVGRSKAVSSWTPRRRLCVKQQIGAIWNPNWPIEGPDGPPIPPGVPAPGSPTTDVGYENGVLMEYVCQAGYPQCGEYPRGTTRGAALTGWGIVPAPSISGGIVPAAHRWWQAAADYWQSGDFCPPWKQTIVWKNTGDDHILGRAPFNGCWYDGYRWAQLNNYYSPRTQGFPPENSWCAVVLHEQGHQLGYYWQQYGGYPWYDPYHNYGDKESIMWPAAIRVPSRCRY